MLKKLIINHFKSLENVDVDLSNINVFVGNNASGKSNIIDAIRFIRDAMINGLDRAIGDRHGIESVRQWSPTRPFRLSFRVVLDEGVRFRAKYHFGIDSQRGEFRVVAEDAEIFEGGEPVFFDPDADEKEPAPLRYSKKIFRRDQKGRVEFQEWTYDTEDPAEVDADRFWDNPGFFDPKSKPRARQTMQADELLVRSRTWEWESLRSRLANFQAYSIYPNTLRTPQEPSNETFLVPEGRNLASVLKRMRRSQRGTEAISQITEAMQSIMPNLERISVLTVGGFLVPQFHVVEASGRRHIFNVSQLSDGTLRVLGLLTALYQVPRPSVIALEEPEQTVNPGVLTVLADSIKEAGRRTQILISTHSPNLLDEFSAELVRTVEFSGGRTRVDRVSANQIEVVKDRLFTLGELLVSEGLHG